MNENFDFAVFPVLTTARLHLRQLTHDDAAAVINIFGQPEVLQYLNLDPVTTPDKAIDLIDYLNKEFTDKNGVNWAVTLPGDDRVIGICGNHNWYRTDRHMDIGYSFASAYWGKGYATEATHAIIRWTFEHFDVHRIQADCTDGNLASERVLLKCGFKVEGIWRESCWEHGRFVDIKQFGLLRREYVAATE